MTIEPKHDLEVLIDEAIIDEIEADLPPEGGDDSVDISRKQVTLRAITRGSLATGRTRA